MVEKKKVIQIKICKFYSKNKYMYRVGDVAGSTEMTNVSIEKILNEIKEEIEELVAPYG